MSHSFPTNEEILADTVDSPRTLGAIRPASA